jgi:hypothetical protein
MKRKYEAAILGVLLLGLIVFVAYQFVGSNKTPSTLEASYSTDLQKLRADFNADKGKVRLVLLLSPT